MLRYIDLDTFTYQRRLTGYPVEQEAAKRGVALSISIQFVRGCVVQELDPNPTNGLNSIAVGTFGLKMPDAINKDYFVVGPAYWTKSGTGTSTVYTFTPSFSGVALDSALGSAPSVTLVGAINWRYGGIIYATLNPFEFVVQTQLIRGTENALFYPAGPPPNVLSAVTRLVGGVTPTDLDAIPLAAYPIGALFEIEIPIDDGAAKSKSVWQKVAWTALADPATDTGAGRIVTLDYNGSTNRAVLIRVSGL